MPKVVASWSGLYTITPDWSMIVDRAPGVEGMYLAVGGSGHSFKLAPAIGQCLAEMIATGTATTLDIMPPYGRDASPRATLSARRTAATGDKTSLAPIFPGSSLDWNLWTAVIPAKAGIQRGASCWVV